LQKKAGSFLTLPRLLTTQYFFISEEAMVKMANERLSMRKIKELAASPQ